MRDVYKNITHIVFGIILTLTIVFLLFSKACFEVEQEQGNTRTDTIYIDRPYKEIVVQEIEVPKRIYIYKTDTLFRAKIENDTLISGIELNPKMAKIHSITPDGIPLVKEFDIYDYQNLTIDYEGKLNLEKVKHPKRKKLLKKLGKIALFIGGFYAGREVYKR